MHADANLHTLAAFARHVDRQQTVREAIRAANHLGEVAAIAHRLGFATINEERLVEACLGTSHSSWVWHPQGRRWSDHVFILALAMLIDGKPVDSGGTELAQFYAYVEGCPAARQELMATRSRQELIAVARAHGFLVSEACLEAHQQENQSGQVPGDNTPTPQGWP